MAKKHINSEAKKPYANKRRGSRNKTVAPFNEEKPTIHGEHVDNEVSGLDSSKKDNEIKSKADYNLKQEKGADLQQEAGADLTTKNRLKEKPSDGVGDLPTYGNYIKDRKKYYKHAAKVKEYAQPYKSTLTDEPQTPKKSEPDNTEKHTDDEGNSDAYVVETEDAKRDGKLSEKTSALEHSESGQSLKSSPEKPRHKYEPKKPLVPSDNSTKESKLKPDKTKLCIDSQSKLETEAPDRLSHDTKGKTQQEINHKKGERFINNSKPPKHIEYQHKLHDKADKLTENASKLREQQKEAVSKMPTKTITTKGRVYDEETGKITNVTNIERCTLHQNEARWNNPNFTDKLKNAEGVKEKSKLIVGEVCKKGVVLGAAGAVGAAPAAVVAKPALKYGSKLMITAAHRQVRKDIRQNGDNEVLKVTHWAEQKGERALGQGIRKLNPMSVRRYIKNAPYRRESKLKIKELKNDKKLGLLRVKQDKATGVNHMTGKKSNAVTRVWQKRQIKKNYQKAMIAAKGKGGGGTLSAMAREIARGNPKAIITLLAKKIAIVATKVVAKLTIFNPLFWKLMAIVLMFLIILASIQACVAILSPGLAGIGFVNDEDIEFSTRIYSEWETDLAIFVRDSNITTEYPPPTHITSQPTVNGEVVYPPPPYTPPPPFFEYRYEIGMISHDPMELISYLTAVYGERFDEGSDNPMTRNGIEAILREVFEAQYGIAPGEFVNLIHTEEETRFRRERRTVTETLYDVDGLPYEHTEIVYVDVYYQFWILTARLEPRNLSEVLRNRMTEDEEMHFDVLNLTGNGRQIVGNPFDFNWLPYISSHYGYRIHPISNDKQMHMGIDIAAPIGTPLYATHTGAITQVQTSATGYGNMIRLRGLGSDGVSYYTLFAHLDEIHVTEGQEVNQGDLIATVGNSGDSTGPHLHLEVIRPAQTVTIEGTNINLDEMRLNPMFAVITWTDEQSNEAFRPLPGAGGIRQVGSPFIPTIPPEAMSDVRFAAILTEGSRHLGARYVWGGAGSTTFDCSGFIHWVFSNANIGWTHGRTTAQGYFNISTPVSSENAKPGDLVFFHSTHSGAFVTHVGIYIGNGQMLHTGGNPAGVEFVSINTPFWQRHFYAFGRV
jgi:cell wall-associated NlpC family hydrolase